MIIYKDKFTGDELFTDAYKVCEENTFFKFTGKLTTRKEGDIDDSLIGGNASAQEAQEQTEAGFQSGLDFALSARLQSVAYDKKTMQTYLKGYFKELKKKCFPGCSEGEDATEYETKVQEFEARAKEFAGFIMKSFKDLEFFFGETDHAGEYGCCFVNWTDGTEVEVYVFKDSVDREKY